MLQLECGMDSLLQGLQFDAPHNACMTSYRGGGRGTGLKIPLLGAFVSEILLLPISCVGMVYIEKPMIPQSENTL